MRDRVTTLDKGHWPQATVWRTVRTSPHERFGPQPPVPAPRPGLVAERYTKDIKDMCR
jgi:hypothetical protein